MSQNADIEDAEDGAALVLALLLDTLTSLDGKADQIMTDVAALNDSLAKLADTVTRVSGDFGTLKDHVSKLEAGQAPDQKTVDAIKGTVDGLVGKLSEADPIVAAAPAPGAPVASPTPPAPGAPSPASPATPAPGAAQPVAPAPGTPAPTAPAPGAAQPVAPAPGAAAPAASPTSPAASAEKTFYTFDGDATQVNHDIWPLAPVKTPDGKALYHYVGDTNPGDKHGDGLNNVWHAYTGPTQAA